MTEASVACAGIDSRGTTVHHGSSFQGRGSGCAKRPAVEASECLSSASPSLDRRPTQSHSSFSPSRFHHFPAPTNTLSRPVRAVLVSSRVCTGAVTKAPGTVSTASSSADPAPISTLSAAEALRPAASAASTPTAARSAGAGPHRAARWACAAASAARRRATPCS